jgi:UDP-glucose 4-epimerase
MTSVLVVGGAGYIGSHMVKLLDVGGHDVVTFDSLRTGHRDAVLAGEFVHGDLLDRDALERLFAARRFDVVMHFAALAYVRESVLEPRSYYQGNVVGTLNLVHAMLDAGVKRLVFSSSCATYGETSDDIDESTSQAPINPYGFTKLAMERVLKDYAVPYGLNTVALRYFNAAGADRQGQLRERHDPEPHLIPLVLREAQRVLSGGRPEDTALVVFGDDFPTPDGSCLRDYVHVEDICQAHLLAMGRLFDRPGLGFQAFNLGSERGYSVKEVIRVAREVTGADIRYRTEGRKAGDPARLVSRANRAMAELGWCPQCSTLPEIVQTAMGGRLCGVPGNE